MDEHFEALIDRAIGYTRAYLGTPGGARGSALAGLARIVADLIARAPAHPVVARLREFHDELGRSPETDCPPAPSDPTDR